MTKEIAVIGGSGFLGTHLLKELGKRDCSIKLLSSRTNFAEDHLSRLREELSGCSAIVYLSGINRERQRGDFEKVHVDNLKLVIEAVKVNKDAPKIVYISFLKARTGTVSHYLQSKWDGENLLRSSGLDYTILKPGICFGAGDQMIGSIVRGLRMTPFIGIFAAVGMREPTMRPVHAQDFALIIAAAVLEGKLSRQTNAVVGPEEFPLSEAVLRVAKVLQKKVFIMHFPVAIMFGCAWVLEHLMKNSLVTVSQIRMLADGLSDSSEVDDADRQALPRELEPKTNFTKEQIQIAIDQIR